MLDNRKVWDSFSEEQKDFFIETWESHRNDAAKVILGPLAYAAPV